MNVTYSDDEITPFGGLHFVFDLLADKDIDRLINTQLCPRAANSQYRWSDLVYGMLAILFCGGDCAEDIDQHVGPYLDSDHLQVPSPDTLLRLQKTLASRPTEYQSTRGVAHQFNWNGPLARLNLKMLKKLGLLETGGGYTLDYDNVILATEKADARRTYRNHYGYQPGVGMIDDKIVYVENRNGNSEPMYQQYRTLRRLFGLLKGQGIPIKRFRADSGSYVGAVVDWVSRQCESIYIKARLNSSVKARIGRITDWEQGPEGGEWASITFTPFKRPRNRWSEQPPQTFRLVVERRPDPDGQGNLFTSDAYDYQAILTSDWKASAQQVFAFYRRRGRHERSFDVLKNDFGWKQMPFSRISQNTVYLLLTALIRNVYGFVIDRLSDKLEYLQPTYRLKKFIFRFITVPAKWIHRARQWWLKLYTPKLYPD